MLIYDSGKTHFKQLKNSLDAASNISPSAVARMVSDDTEEETAGTVTLDPNGSEGEHKTVPIMPLSGIVKLCAVIGFITFVFFRGYSFQVLVLQRMR